MKIIKLGEPKVIMDNPHSRHNYFGWPTVTRLQNGKIAVVASGFRLRHVCPFGKTVISYSEDEGESYTRPAPIIDTPLDDRDGGIMTFGEKGVIVTSFNNTVNFQRKHNSSDPYALAYLDTVTPESESKYLASNFRISQDCGVSFGEIFKSPVTSPHGPLQLSDGTILWVGRTFSSENIKVEGADGIKAYKINLDGSCEYMGGIENISEDGIGFLSCEPHTAELDNGRLITHIRVQYYKGNAPIFTIFQSVSDDRGRTWSNPRQILERKGGAPSHIMKHSSGVLVATYGYREAPYGIRAMFSSDGGDSWDTDHDLYVNGISLDLGYPSTVELSDRSLLTVFYAHPLKDEPAVIMQQKWRFEK